MTNILTGFAIVNDRNGKRVTYTYDIVDDNGNIIEDNKNASYIVMDKGEKNVIEQIETMIEGKMSSKKEQPVVYAND